MKNNNIDLKQLWCMQKADAPNEKEVYAKAESLKKSIRTKAFMITSMMIATGAAIILVVINSGLQKLTTGAGTGLVLTAVLIAMINAMKTINSVDNLTADNSSYLQQLLKLKKQQEIMQTRLLSVYFILLSAGIAFYMIEPVSYMPLRGGLIAYCITFAWIAFNWFYIRPKVIKKQERKFRGIVEQLERINKNLAMNE